jgi:hypothetical protein
MIPIVAGGYSFLIVVLLIEVTFRNQKANSRVPQGNDAVGLLSTGT